MSYTSEKSAVKIRIKLKSPKLYDVWMINDDFTTMEFVVEVLTAYFHHSAEKAEQLMLQIHREGKAVAGTFIYDLAITKKRQVEELARERQFPLCLEVKEHR